jgi:hypothetical protein
MYDFWSRHANFLEQLLHRNHICDGMLQFFDDACLLWTNPLFSFEDVLKAIDGWIKSTDNILFNGQFCDGLQALE